MVMKMKCMMNLNMKVLCLRFRKYKERKPLIKGHMIEKNAELEKIEKNMLYISMNDDQFIIRNF